VLLASTRVVAALGLAGLGVPATASAQALQAPQAPAAERPRLTGRAPTLAAITLPNLRDRAEINLFCQGHLDGPRWLDGRTHEGSVGLAPRTSAPYTGTRWRVRRPDPNRNDFWLYCLGNLQGSRWLDGRTHDGSVGLAPNTDPPYTGTLWSFYNPPDEADLSIVYLYGRGQVEGPRWLDGRTHNGTVGLAPGDEQPDPPFTGARWQLVTAGGID
jgi:hypothetical protein